MLADDLTAFWPKLVYWLTPRCGDAEGVAAEAVFRSWVAEQRGAEINHGYVFQTANRILIDQHRGPRGWPTAALDPDALAIEHDPTDADEAERLLALVPANAALAIKMEAAGYSGAETAERLGVTVQAVKSLKHRARARLRGEREPHGGMAAAETFGEKMARAEGEMANQERLLDALAGMLRGG